jgi:hypothetical protein
MPSNGAELAETPAWRRASVCAASECIEVAQRDDRIAVRDSTQPRGIVLRYTAPEWRSFVRLIKTGRLDRL